MKKTSILSFIVLQFFLASCSSKPVKPTKIALKCSVDLTNTVEQKYIPPGSVFNQVLTTTDTINSSEELTFLVDLKNQTVSSYSDNNVQVLNVTSFSPKQIAFSSMQNDSKSLNEQTIDRETLKYNSQTRVLGELDSSVNQFSSSSSKGSGICKQVEYPKMNSPKAKF